jgi:hypothetical protein
MPSGLREPYHNRSIDRRKNIEIDAAQLGGATPARPKVPRVMSYLSVHSSELDQPLSDEEREDDDDEIGKTLREAARREGRKMSLAALTRAAEREKADVMGPTNTDTREEVLDTDASDSAQPEEGDMSGVTPKIGTLQIVDQTPTATPAMVSGPLPVPEHDGHQKEAAHTEPDVRSEIQAHTPVSDGLEQIDEVEESSQIGDEDSFRVSAYGGIHTDDEPASRPDSRGLEWAPISSKALEGYSEDLLQPIAVLPELSLDDVLRERKWSMDMRVPAPESRAMPEEEEDDDDKPLALIAKASPKPDGMATPKRSAQPLDSTRDLERTPTQTPATPMSPPFAYDQPSPVPAAARLPPAPRTPPSVSKQNVPKVYENTSFRSTSSLGGTGLTSSTNRAPSRKGSALDPQTLLRVSDERDPPTVHRYESRFGSFAASTSAMSDQESEIGQVQQAVKRNLSVKNRAEVVEMDMDSRYADEEADDQVEPAMSTPPLSPRQDRSGHAVVRGGRSPVKWSQSQLTPTLQPSPSGSQMHGPRAMGSTKSSSYFLEARRRSSGISPRTNYQPVIGDSSASAPMTRTASALRHQVPLETPASLVLDSPMQEQAEESTLPPLAPSIDGDSSSDGHALDSPHLLDTPGQGLDHDKGVDQEQASHVAHQQLLADMRNLATPTPKSALNSPMTRQGSKDNANGPQLNPDWVPGDHLLHTEVAFARTSFSLPAGPASDDTHSHAHTMTSHHSHSHSSSIPSMPNSRNNSDGFSPVRRPSQSRDYGTRSSRGHGLIHGHHGQRSTSPTPTAASVRSMKSAHSSHSVVLSGMQYKLQHMQARDEALRKFSVASAASSGRRESMLGELETGMPAIPASHAGQQGYPGYQGYSHGDTQQYTAAQRQLGVGQPSGQMRITKPRKSYTAALGPRA